jgi:hypothetical protein
MYENGKMRTVGTIPGMRYGGENGGGSEFNCGIL